MNEAIAFGTFDDFLDGEQLAESRYEFVGSRTYAMAGGSERHDLMAGLLFQSLASGAFARRCRPFTSNRLVRTRDDNAYYPDVMVSCGEAAHRLYETDPCLVIEVLSPSTSNIDRREKAVAYGQIAALRLLLLVDPNSRRIEVARPVDGHIGAWTVAGSGDVIATDFGDLDIDALYDALEAAATTA